MDSEEEASVAAVNGGPSSQIESKGHVLQSIEKSPEGSDGGLVTNGTSSAADDDGYDDYYEDEDAYDDEEEEEEEEDEDEDDEKDNANNVENIFDQEEDEDVFAIGKGKTRAFVDSESSDDDPFSAPLPRLTASARKPSSKKIPVTSSINHARSKSSQSKRVRNTHSTAVNIPLGSLPRAVILTKLKDVLRERDDMKVHMAKQQASIEKIIENACLQVQRKFEAKLSKYNQVEKERDFLLVKLEEIDRHDDNENRYLNGEVGQLNKRLQETESKLTDLANLLEEADRVQHKLTKDAQRTDQELHETRAKLSKLRIAYASKEKELEKITQRNAHLQSRYESQYKDAEDLKSQLKDERSTLMHQTETLDTHVKALRAELKTIEAKNKATLEAETNEFRNKEILYKQNQAELETRLYEAESLLDKKDEDIEELQATAESYHHNITLLSERLQRRNDTISGLNSQIHSLEIALEESKQKEHSTSQKFHTAASKIGQLEDTLRKYRAELSSKTIEVDNILKTQVEHDQIMAELQAENDQLRVELNSSEAALSTEIANRNEWKRIDKNRMESAIEKARRLETTLEESRRQVRLLTDRERDLHLALTDIETKYEQLRVENDELKHQSSLYEERIDELEQEFNSALRDSRSEIEVLNSELLNTRTKLERERNGVRRTTDEYERTITNLQAMLTSRDHDRDSQYQQEYFNAIRQLEEERTLLANRDIELDQTRKELDALQEQIRYLNTQLTS